MLFDFEVRFLSVERHHGQEAGQAAVLAAQGHDGGQQADQRLEERGGEVHHLAK